MTKSNPTRRQILKLGASLPAVVAAASVVGRARDAQAQKMAKAQAQYQDTPKNGQRCDECQFWVAGSGDPGKCQVVEGDIAAAGWCALYAPAS